MRRLCLALPLLAACGVEDDNRPLELDYLTSAILAPSCAQAQCHSSFRQAGNVALDTPENVRTFIVDDGGVNFDSLQYDPSAPEASRLMVWITQTDPEGRGIGRMPFDAPLPEKDSELLAEWISVGAPGAQCNPDTFEGLACNNTRVVDCNPDWTFGQTRITCPDGCTTGPNKPASVEPDPLLRWCR